MGCRGRNWVHLPQDCVHLPQDRVQWRALVNTSNETSCLIKGFELLNQLRNYQLLKEDSAPKLRGWLVFRSRKFQYEESNTNWAWQQPRHYEVTCCIKARVRFLYKSITDRNFKKLLNSLSSAESDGVSQKNRKEEPEINVVFIKIQRAGIISRNIQDKPSTLHMNISGRTINSDVNEESPPLFTVIKADNRV